MSHLLQIPRELRDEIYELVLGTRTVHLISQELPSPLTIVQEASGSDLSENETVYSDELYCERCVETSTEQEAYEISQDPDLNDPYGIMPGATADRCRYCRRHNRCTRGWGIVPWIGNSEHRPTDTVHHPKSHNSIAILQISRTVYHEASAILYANTIFSFKLAHTLTSFSRNLAPLQAQAVRSIHLDINLNPEHPTWAGECDDLSGALLLLPKLRNLHLLIKQGCQGDFGAFMERLHGDSLPLWKNDLIHFQNTALRNVAVVVEDIDSSDLQELKGTGLWQLRRNYLKREGHWTMAERAEYARVLRDKLLAILPVSSTRARRLAS